MTHLWYFEKLYEESAEHSQVTVFLAHTAWKEKFQSV